MHGRVSSALWPPCQLTTLDLLSITSQKCRKRTAGVSLLTAMSPLALVHHLLQCPLCHRLPVGVEKPGMVPQSLGITLDPVQLFDSLLLHQSVVFFFLVGCSWFVFLFCFGFFCVLVFVLFWFFKAYTLVRVIVATINMTARNSTAARGNSF